MTPAPWSRIRGQNSVNKSLVDCWQWKANGQCSKGDNCSFRHDTNKRTKSTRPNPSPGSSTQQNVKNASRTRSLGGRSPSGKKARLPCKDYLKGTCSTLLCEKWHPPEFLFYKSENGCKFGESALMHTAGLMNCLAKKSKKNGNRSAVAMLIENYTTIGLRISRSWAAEVCNDFAEELKHTEANPMCSIDWSRVTSC